MSPSSELHTDILLRSEQSAGHVSIMENIVSAGSAGPPLHKHDFDEGFYMLEGELIFQIGDQRFTRRAGEFAFAPRNVVHTFANHSDQPARALIAVTPAGFERYFRLVSAQLAGTERPADAFGPRPATEQVGPPIPRRHRG